MEAKSRVLLIILDGFGLSEATEGNAVHAANPEFINKLLEERPCTRLGASGLDVGLPEGQMGNSEVGHLNIGAGRIVYQDITRINLAIEDGSFFENKPLLETFAKLKKSGKALHLYGLVSDGGVHSHINHISAILKLALAQGLSRVFIHAFTDGRDTSPTSGVHFIRDLVEETRKIGIGQIASISGRFYAMDRDNRWERVEKAYLAMVHGVGNRATDPVLAMEASYKVNVTDEFVIPVVIEANGDPIATIDDGDTILAFNFRADRMRQITKVFTQPVFEEFKRKEMHVDYLSFTHYSDEFSFPVVFQQQHLDRVLGSVLADNKIAQLRLAETEKYAHVTYFTNGGHEPPFALEDRHMVPSPKVKTYDLKPEMSAFEVSEYLIEKLRTEKYGFILVNFANCDMVGHTGIMEAAMKAVSTVDCVLSKVIPVAYEKGYECIITADHGNAEQMVDTETGEAFTEHTTNPVPCCILSRSSYELRPEGRLSDIAPTVLELLGVDKPAEMTGQSLISRKK
ncbi:MAG: phosphoglycerate mutase (2,3-diphosphoglycerate-independent) [Candidatus Riflebacteria bacterium GWC2_50_8]|nr:MAG: phosphoglycerate mutase (2,3-diphosphoglycerate-independent) [Candidatus Riflebacteria bacterium GWC2_50_8]